LLLLAGVCIFTAEAGNQVLLRNLNPADGTPQILAADRSGHLFVISTFTAASGHPATRVVELDLNGSRLASLDLAQMALPAAAVTDAQGNLIVAGADASYQGLILKLDPQLHGTVFSKSLPANVNAAAVDGSGNIYITGTTSSAAFPVTAGAYQTKPPVGDNFGTAFYAVLSEISPGGDQLLYSTYFGGNYTNCFGGSACVGVYGRTSGTAIAVDSSGALVIAGTTDASDLPTTAGALAPTCLCSNKDYVGFIAKFQPGALQQLQWSTFLNASGSPYSTSVSVNSMALDAAGNVIVGGSAPAGLPTTAGTIQPSIIPVIGTGDSGGFLVKLNNAGTAVIWGTYFSGSPFSHVKALRVDAQGRVQFTGVMVNPSAPALPNDPSFRQTYVARMASDATSLSDYDQGPLDVVGQDLVLTAAGGFAALGALGTLWIETAAPGPSLLAVTNSASGQYSSAVAPSELITLYGVGLGPLAPVSGQVQNGAFTSSLGGVQVLFNGVAAPLLYAGSGQINVVVPRAVYTSTHVQVVTPTGTVDGPTLPVSLQPGIFQNSQTGFAAALNQDGSVNSPSNPARAGAIVSVFATGAGAGSFNDGALVPMGIYNASASVWAGNQRSFEVEFAGDAPGLVAGVMQINFRLPDSLPPGNTLSFSLIIGGVSTSQNQIAVVP
jgi:uncharacterized protein (TIGR03437 family)